MSLLSLAVFVILILISTATTNVTKEQSPSTTISSIQNFKEFISNMIKDQSLKIQALLKKIQTNAHSVLMKIDNIKQDSKNGIKYLGLKNNLVDERQVEVPILKKSLEGDGTDIGEGRNFNNYHGTSNYGATGSGNYGGHMQTYHHHSIGFDPINIVVSVSLLSFLLQALQGLLGRTRFPTQVVEARSSTEDWLKKLEAKYAASPKLGYKKPKYSKAYTI